MMDYEPLDLTSLCNVGTEVLAPKADPSGPDAADLAWRGHSFGSPEEHRPRLGLQTLRGLPFLIGADAGNCFIEVGGPGPAVTVPVGKQARRIIVAHRLLEPSDGPSIATPVAEYVFRTAKGVKHTASIRQGIEIGGAFGSVGDIGDGLQPRYQGLWGQVGRRQNEVGGSGPGWYDLWVWENPDPETSVHSLEIVPKGARFILAAITLGRTDEHPFPRGGMRPARIVLKDAGLADQPFDMDVDVDRGDAAYPHPLPRASADDFVSDSAHRGWGEPQNTLASPAYVDLSAVPSATVAVRQGGEEVDSVNWGTVESKGAVETPRMRVELVEPGKNGVHVTVLDDDTGRPVPCRVHFRSPEGVPYQPYGHHDHVNSNLGTYDFDIGGDLRLGQITYAYIDGTCQGWLPRGEVIVDVARGFEYEPVRQKVTIESGQRELTLRLKRWTNMNANGWYSGDSHVHFLSAQGSHTESQGEDLNVVNLLQSQWGNHFTSTEEFTGAPSVSRMGDNIVYVCQENRQSPMGHLILWGLKRHVMPWCTDGGGETEMGATMEITLSDWADQCHEQGGTVIAPHFGGLTGETAALIATGRLEGIEMIYLRENTHEEYYRTLNCGYRIPLLGGTDKMTADIPVGLYRTYVKLGEGEEFSYETWCQNVAKGRTFLSGGPIIHMSVDGREIGDTIALSGPGTVEVEAWAESIFPISTLEIVQAGRVVASTGSAHGTRRLELKEKLRVDGHTWLAARCGGPGYWTAGNFSSGQIPATRPIPSSHYDGQRKGIYAHTSPIYVSSGGDWEMFDEATARRLLNVFDGDLNYIRNVSRQHSHGRVTHHHGEDDHIAHLERPFLQARDAVSERMRRHGISL